MTKEVLPLNTVRCCMLLRQNRIGIKTNGGGPEGFCGMEVSLSIGAWFAATGGSRGQGG